MEVKSLHSFSCYDVRSDVWSLGITLVEVSTGRFPYPNFENMFEQLNCVVNEDPPILDVEKNHRFSKDYMTFVNKCLIKEVTDRPKYDTLLEEPVLRHVHRDTQSVAEFLAPILA